LLIAWPDARAQVLTHGGVAPLTRIPSEQWIEKVVGGMDEAGQAFVIRIHHDAGYVVFSHTRIRKTKCSPANRFTQYWVKKASGERFWTTLKDLKPLP